jgi:hypothetical protein
MDLFKNKNRNSKAYDTKLSDKPQFKGKREKSIQVLLILQSGFSAFSKTRGYQNGQRLTGVIY